MAVPWPCFQIISNSQLRLQPAEPQRLSGVTFLSLCKQTRLNRDPSASTKINRPLFSFRSVLPVLIFFLFWRRNKKRSEQSVGPGVISGLCRSIDISATATKLYLTSADERACVSVTVLNNADGIEDSVSPWRPRESRNEPPLRDKLTLSRAALFYSQDQNKLCRLLMSEELRRPHEARSRHRWTSSPTHTPVRRLHSGRPGRKRQRTF